MTPLIIRLLGRPYAGVARDLLTGLASRDRGVWEESLDELIFRHMLAGGVFGIALVGVAAVIDEYAPRFYTVVVGVTAGLLLALLISIFWLTAQAQRARRLDEPPSSVLNASSLAGRAPVVAGILAAALWIAVDR